MNTLPPELIKLILINIPPNTALSYRTVCSLWNYLISTFEGYLNDDSRLDFIRYHMFNGNIYKLFVLNKLHVNKYRSINIPFVNTEKSKVIKYKFPDDITGCWNVYQLNGLIYYSSHFDLVIINNNESYRFNSYYKNDLEYRHNFSINTVTKDNRIVVLNQYDISVLEQRDNKLICTKTIDCDNIRYLSDEDFFVDDNNVYIQTKPSKIISLDTEEQTTIEYDDFIKYHIIETNNGINHLITKVLHKTDPGFKIIISELTNLKLTKDLAKIVIHKRFVLIMDWSGAVYIYQIL